MNTIRRLASALFLASLCGSAPAPAALADTATSVTVNSVSSISAPATINPDLDPAAMTDAFVVASNSLGYQVTIESIDGTVTFTYSTL